MILSTATDVVLLLTATLASAAFDVGNEQLFPSDFCADFRASDPDRPQIERGVEYWDRLGINAKLEAYITAHGKDDWVRTIAGDLLASHTTIVDNCDFNNISECFKDTTCDEFKHAHGAAIIQALKNLHLLLTAQADAYDTALALWEENDAERAKALFSEDISFGRRLGEFDVGAFFKGFLLGIELAVPAISKPLTTVIRKAIQKGVKASLPIKTLLVDELREEINLGDDPSKEAGPFLDSLRRTYDQEKRALRAVIESYFFRGNTDPSVESSAQDLVDFLQNGELLRGFSQSKEELVQDAAREIVRQTLAASLERKAAPIIASVWRDEGAKIEFLVEPTCVDLGGDFDLERGQVRAQISPFFMNGRDVILNAAKCKIDGFPEQQEGDEMLSGVTSKMRPTTASQSKLLPFVRPCALPIKVVKRL
ncbi:hypothetical protein ACRE_038210 [Hapsidospora chrysogenum ATCC 11550]|uniref:Uncharacterized protein n=1 Tax=Hapsidospora chrysogenum (strain ATCC 11550 / CBS 779.69 / DSM 880 / IAM 14645 / JCM 23072 / IMI 49137) TaxID=857340 RepID=A0A086T7Q8_HAPC1|nr:hypothetical protein ACRE_038210 [Hapsidospora chrysogenum ATCC 11550]